MRGYRGGSFGKGWGRASTLRGLLLLRRQRARLSEGVCDEEVHLEPPEAADAKSFGVTFIALEPVRKLNESLESFVNQGRRPDLFGGRRCGRVRIAGVTSGAGCAIRAT